MPARLRHFLQLRTQWLNISGEHVASMARVGQAVMHLELSRCVSCFCCLVQSESIPLGRASLPVLETY